MPNSHVQIIYLNGPSSSGKTTLAKALQHALDDLFLHVGIDKIIGWMPEKVNDWTAPLKPSDRVAIISPSSGMPFVFPWVYERLRTIFQLEPIEFPTACQSPEYLSRN